MTKVLLVQPTEYREFYNLDRDYSRYLSRELGLLHIGSMLADNNTEVKLIPGIYNKEKTFSLLKKHCKNFDIIGTTCLTPEINIALDILKKSKEINPNIKTIIGGQHVTWMDKKTIKNPFIDIVVKGEGENSFLEIVRKKKLQDIKGITFRKENKIKKNTACNTLKEIPKLNKPLLTRYLNDIDKEVSLGSYQKFQFNHMVTRGCPYNCSYCIEPKFWGHTLRFKKIKHIIEENNLITNSKSCKRIFFMDSTFTANRKYAENLCKEIKKQNYDIKFKCYTKINIYDKKISTTLAKANFSLVYFGIEHFHPYVQKMMNKKANFNEIIKGLKNAKSVNQFTGSFLLIGHPGDNLERSKYSYKKTEHLIKKKMLDEITPFTFVPYPGTDIFNNPNKYNLKILTKDFSKYARIYEPVISYKDFSKDEIEIMFRFFTKLAFKTSSVI